MEDNFNKNNKESIGKRTEEEIREDLSNELHEYALILQKKAQIIATLSAGLVDDEEEMELEEFLNKCEDNEILLNLIEDIKEEYYES